MVERTHGLTRTEEIKVDDRIRERGPAPSGAVPAYATLRFHPKCAERLEDSIRQKREALAQAARGAIPSIEDAIQRLQRNPDAVDSAAAERIAEMLQNALTVMQSSLEPCDAPDRDAMNQQKREMLDLEARLLAALQEVRAAQN